MTVDPRLRVAFLVMVAVGATVSGAATSTSDPARL